MKKICLVFTGSQYESWNKNGIIDRLNQNFKLEIYIVNPKEKFESLGKNAKIVTVQDPGKVIRALYDINQIQNLGKSKSFVFRLKRMYFGPVDLKKYSWNTFIFYKILILKLRTCLGFSIRNLVLTVALFRIFNRILSIILRVVFWNSLSRSRKKADNVFQNSDAQLVIFPSTGIELQVFNMLAMARISGKQTLITLENWDNLTSKSAFLFKPDFLTVMGLKMAFQAEQMYTLNSENIGITGLPRFEKIIDRSLKKNHHSRKSDDATPFKILYLGFSLPYDEVTTINSITNLLIQRGDISNFTLTYRPHPFRQKRFIESKLTSHQNKNILIDHNHFGENRAVSKKLPLIQDNYIDNLFSYDVIITTPTTMALEVMLLNIPTIIDGIDDQIHITTPKNVLKSYLHLGDLSEISNATISFTPQNIVNNLVRIWSMPSREINYDLKRLFPLQSTFTEAFVEFLQNIQPQSK